MAIRINGTGYSSTTNQTFDSTKATTIATESGRGGGTIGDNYHGSFHMANNPHVYEVQRNNNFEFVVDFGESNLIEAGLTVQTSTESYKPMQAQEIIRMSVVSSSVPHFTQDVIQIKRGNSTIKYAGTPTFQDGSLTLNDYIGADTIAVLMAWQNLSYNVETEKVGLAADYKKTAYLMEYTPDYQLVRTWILYGCWITGIQEGEFNNEDGGKHSVSASISYDKAVLESAPTSRSMRDVADA